MPHLDDNKYDAGVSPCLEFVRFPGRLVVLNNELGFDPDDVARLCDINKSKKTGMGEEIRGMRVTYFTEIT